MLAVRPPSYERTRGRSGMSKKRRDTALLESGEAKMIRRPEDQ